MTTENPIYQEGWLRKGTIMISFRDTTFCASKVKHTCDREFTKQDAIDAEKWWGGKDYPVAWSYFCDEPKSKEQE